MPNQVKHTRDAMLDTARALVLDGGPAAASARAVALALGAPSGSIYHRFPRRDDLVAAAWLRAQDRFLDAYLTAAQQSPTAGATRVLTWSAENPADAALLLRHALPDLLRGEVSPTLATQAATNNTRAETAVRTTAEALDLPLDDVVLALVDLPWP
ncbi:TetR/AcrR family transcriptional regulator [Actinokineospora soli]|uniref:TetR/AcrR family transcriptional regulator n=1 Tax=Actinokineospora soli TaxID=1048753 RepID=A0ABW2TRJ7_9PSEU